MAGRLRRRVLVVVPVLALALGPAQLAAADVAPTEPPGGQDQWTGDGTAPVVATTIDSIPKPTEAISFRCDLCLIE